MEEKAKNNIYKYRKTYRKKEGHKILQKCIWCHQWKSINEFARENKSYVMDGKLIEKHRRRNQCKTCQSNYYKKWYQKNREYELARQKYYNDKAKNIKNDFVFKSEQVSHFDKAFKKYFEYVKKEVKEIKKKIIKQREKRKEKLQTIWKS